MDPSEQKALRIGSMIALVVAVVWAGFMTFRILYWTPAFEKVFLDFNTSLPTLTIWMLSPWFKFLVPGIALFAIIKEWLPDKTVTLVLNGLVIVLLLAIQELYPIAMYEGLRQLIKSVSGGS